MKCCPLEKKKRHYAHKMKFTKIITRKNNSQIKLRSSKPHPSRKISKEVLLSNFPGAQPIRIT